MSTTSIIYFAYIWLVTWIPNSGPKYTGINVCRWDQQYEIVFTSHNNTISWLLLIPLQVMRWFMMTEHAPYEWSPIPTSLAHRVATSSASDVNFCSTNYFLQLRKLLFYQLFLQRILLWFQWHLLIMVLLGTYEPIDSNIPLSLLMSIIQSPAF